jgi:hypothetical protein
MHSCTVAAHLHCVFPAPVCLNNTRCSPGKYQNLLKPHILANAAPVLPVISLHVQTKQATMHCASSPHTSPTSPANSIPQQMAMSILIGLAFILIPHIASHTMCQRVLIRYTLLHHAGTPRTCPFGGCTPGYCDSTICCAKTYTLHQPLHPAQPFQHTLPSLFQPTRHLSTDYSAALPRRVRGSHR